MSLRIVCVLGLAACTSGAPSGLDRDPAAGTSARMILSAAWTAEPDQVNAWFGTSVSSAGDVNNDGYADIVVGAPGWTSGEAAEGAAFLHLGTPSGPSARPAWSAESDEAGARFGWAVAGAGDVNGDGYDDVVVGANGFTAGSLGEGRASVFHGTPYGLESTPVWTAESDQLDALLGASVSGAGDVNGDGYDDVVVGARAFSNGAAEEGAAYVYLGSESGLSTVADWSAEGDQEAAWFGHSVSSAGDVNNDGFDDLIVGAPLHDGGQLNEGEVSVFHGSAVGLSTNSAWTVQSDENLAELGVSVAAAGDVDDDGYADVIVGATTPSGSSLLYRGGPLGLETTAAWTAQSDQIGSLFGMSVAGAGDVNGDGYSDVIVGAVGYDGGRADEGSAFLFLGSASGLAATPTWTAESDQAGAGYAVSVSPAGDVNADGYADVIVGAGLYDNGSVDEGRVYVYPGGCYDDTVDTDLDGTGDGCDLCSGDDASGDVDRDGVCALEVDGAQKDCDDADDTVYPGAVELCDGLDNGCIGTIASAELDTDGDGWFTCNGDCADGDDLSYPGAIELCDGVDNACEGVLAADEADSDGDGIRECDGDCNDVDAATSPLGIEVCDDFRDNDCDQRVDEDCGGDLGGDDARIVDEGGCDGGCHGSGAGGSQVPGAVLMGIAALFLSRLRGKAPRRGISSHIRRFAPPSSERLGAGS